MNYEDNRDWFIFGLALFFITILLVDIKINYEESKPSYKLSVIYKIEDEVIETTNICDKVIVRDRFGIDSYDLICQGETYEIVYPNPLHYEVEEIEE